MDILIKLGLYCLGVITSVFMIPMIEKKKSKSQKKESLEELFIELDDIHVELIEHLESSFQFLLNLRTKKELAENGRIPVPMPKNINTDVLSELYKKSALILTSPQRLAIKRIPNSINEIMRHSQRSFNNETGYCIISLKNTIKLGCLLLHQINFLREHRERFLLDNSLNSNVVVSPVLKSIGYTETQIAQSRIEESQFTNLNVPI